MAKQIAQVGKLDTENRKAEEPTELGLGFFLLQIVDWWMTAMEMNAAAHGVPALTRSQGLLIAHVGLGQHRPVRLAEKLGITRQAVHFLINQLSEMSVITVRKDPDDLRATIVDLVPGNAAHAEIYLSIMSGLEVKLAERIGKENVDIFRDVVRSDWGEPPILTKAELKRAAKERGMNDAVLAQVSGNRGAGTGNR